MSVSFIQEHPIKLQAKLRVCASCEWIFHISDAKNGSCPKCGFGHYGARYVYGNKCYRYKETQEPWLEKLLAIYKGKLLDEIDLWNGVTTAKRSVSFYGDIVGRNKDVPCFHAEIQRFCTEERWRALVGSSEEVEKAHLEGD